MLQLLILALFIAATPLSASAAESCPAMGVIATNYANAAYQGARDEPDLIDRIGPFDAWMYLLGALLKDGEESRMQSTEFFSAAKRAGNTLVANKPDIIKTIASQGYVPLFSRMTIRFCEGLGSTPDK